MRILAPLVVVLIPLLITPGLLFYYDVTPKVFAVLLGAGAMLTLASWRGFELPSGTNGRWLRILVAAQALSLLAATLLSSNPALSASGSNWRRLGLVSQLAILVFALVPGRTLPILRAMIAGGIPVSLYVVAQYLGWDPWVDPRAYHIGEGPATIVRPPGTLGYASYAATYLLHVVFAGVAVVRLDDRVWWRRAALAATALGGLAIVLTGTRAAFLALLAGGVVLLIGDRSWLSRRVVFAGLGMVVVLAGLYVSPLGEKLRARTRWSMEDPRGGARPLLWRDSVRMAGARWLTGWGPETFVTEFPRYESKALAQAYPDFYHESPHNMFLDALAQQGIPGLAILVALCVLAWRGGSPELRAMLAAVLLSQQFTVFTVPTAFFFYLTIGLMVGRNAAPVRVKAMPLLAVPAAAFAVAAIWLVTGDRLLEVTRQRLAARDPQGAAVSYESARRRQPPGVTADLWYSRAMAQFAQAKPGLVPTVLAVEQAFNAAERACSHAEDRANACYNAASLYAVRNDFAGLERSLRQAIALAPNWFKPHWTLAKALLLAGRIPEATAEAELAADLDGGKHPEVAATLAELKAKK